MSRNKIIAIVVIIVVLGVAVFPTTNVRNNEDLVKTLDCSRTLSDDESLSDGWTDMEDQTKIVVQIQSDEDVRITLKGVPNATVYDPVVIYDETKEFHTVTIIRSNVTYEITVRNPTWFGTGPSAVMTGDIKAYHLYNVHQLLPWWMP
ncbi:MAG: hypothetical protein PVG48_03905 [Candidatus Bathyarchaeota archaeon]